MDYKDMTINGVCFLRGITTRHQEIIKVYLNDPNTVIIVIDNDAKGNLSNVGCLFKPQEVAEFKQTGCYTSKVGSRLFYFTEDQLCGGTKAIPFSPEEITVCWHANAISPHTAQNIIFSSIGTIFSEPDQADLMSLLGF